jgi:hypothetical protein
VIDVKKKRIGAYFVHLGGKGYYPQKTPPEYQTGGVFC